MIDAAAMKNFYQRHMLYGTTSDRPPDEENIIESADRE